jgi:inorganic pyrophosphatase
MSTIEKMPAGTVDAFNVIIEIPAQSHPVKYEMDKEHGILAVDRFITTAMQYPCNYGYVPSTLSEDGDPVDVLVFTPYPLIHGCVVKCRTIGMLNMTDEAGVDTKILAVPTEKLCKEYAHIQTAEDLGEPLLKKIEHFFEHYKDLEKGKWVKTAGYSDAATAKAEIQKGIDALKG